MGDEAAVGVAYLEQLAGGGTGTTIPGFVTAAIAEADAIGRQVEALRELIEWRDTPTTRGERLQRLRRQLRLKLLGTLARLLGR